MDITNALVSTSCPNADCNRPMVQRPAGYQTPEQAFCGAWWDCPRCKCSILFPSAALEQQLAERRASLARDAALRNPAIRDAFAAWLSNEAYYDGKGYRLKSDRRRRAAWSKDVAKLYPSCDDFHEAAHASRRWPAGTVGESVSRGITPSEMAPIPELIARREAEVRAGLLK